MEAKSHKLFTDQRHKKVKQTFIDTFQSDPTDRLKDRTNTEKHNVRHGLSPEKWDVEEISHLREIKLNVLQHSGYDPHLKQQANIHTSIRSYCIFWSTKKTFIDKCFSAATLHRLWHWN